MPRDSPREAFDAVRRRLSIDDEGVLSLDGVRTLIVPASLLTEFLRAAQDLLGRGAAALLYRAGERMGRTLAERTLAEAGQGADTRELAGRLVASFTALGFGPLVIADLDLVSGTGVLRAPKCPWVDGTADHPVCHFSAALWAGLVGVLSGRRVVAEETRCLARGDPHCEYAVFPAPD